MTKLTALGARRIRTLLDVGNAIQLRPITVLLGRNSVGKSTYARLFPLLRQSAERKKRAPILWFDELVDFGAFDQAVTRGHDTIDFTFSLEDLTSGNNRVHNLIQPLNWLYSDGLSQSQVNLSKIDICLTLSKGLIQGRGDTFAKEVSISFEGITYKLVANGNREVEHFLIDGKPMQWDRTKFKILFEQGSILPSLIFLELKNQEKQNWSITQNYWENSVVELIQLQAKIPKPTAKQMAAGLPVADKRAVSAAAQNIKGPHSWENFKKSITPTSSLTRSLLEKQGAAHIHILFSLIDEALSTTFKGVRYLKPLRATAERYYRRVDLSVSEIDPEGRNLPIFLDSLPSWQLQEFRSWLHLNLKIDVEPVREGSQITLMAKGHNDISSSNVADMGFGISQVLPIAAQLWASSNRYFSLRPDQSDHIIVLEQPELHLHPAFQAKLADVFAGTIRETSSNSFFGNNTRLVIETHSQQIVNRLGQLVEMGSIKSSDVSIILFDANELIPGTSTVRVSTFDEEGVLKNWPYGFFDADF
jgi:hypothetical protein